MEDAAKPKLNGDKLAKEGTAWMGRIRAAEQREKTWRRDAEAAEKAYSCDSDSKSSGKMYDFNILHSNVETIVPAIYNSTPIPDIRRRFVEAIGEQPAPPQQQEGMQADPRAMMEFRAAAQAYQQKAQADKDAKDLGDMLERVIAHQIDDSRLDTEIEKEAQDAFLSGRGIIRLKFDAKIEGEQATGERIEFETVSWRDYRCGPATRWQDRPWEAFRHSVPREVLELKHVDKEMYAAQGPEVKTNDVDDDDIVFWEIWCEYDRSVKFVREHDGRMLKKVDDPLGLPGFYSTPAAVQPITLTGKITPVCPFVVYKRLADELDLATKRINAIMKGLKVRGLVAGNVGDIANLAQAGDNELVTASDLEALAQTGGIEKAIMWWPIDKAIAVLKELYVQREATKSAIYEITGISDIIRGASHANETATAQQIKTQWGSLRIQKMQRMIERQVRDLFCMMADIIVTKFSPETLQRMTGIQITPGMMEMMQRPISTSYRVDVESDSTVRADLTRQKAEMTEFLAGTAQFFSSMAPVVQAKPEMAEPMSEIYSAFARVFKLGKQAEDAMERMTQMAKQSASQPQPNPEQQKLEAEMQAKQAELQIKQQEAAINIQIKERELQLKQAEGQMKMQLEQEKLALERAKMGLEQMRLQMEGQNMAAQGEREERKLAMEGQKTEREFRDKDQDRKMKQNEMNVQAGIAPDFEDARADGIMGGIEELKQLIVAQGEQTSSAIQQLAQVVAAPNELVRDPKTGKATGSRKVMN